MRKRDVCFSHDRLTNILCNAIQSSLILSSIILYLLSPLKIVGKRDNCALEAKKRIEKSLEGRTLYYSAKSNSFLLHSLILFKAKGMKCWLRQTGRRK